MKLTVHLVERSDCYVSLPLSQSWLADSSYSDQSICKAVRLTLMNKQSVYVGYASGVSAVETTIEISSTFAKCIGLEEGDPVNVQIVNNPQSELKLQLSVDSEDSYEMVCHMREKFEEILLNQISIVYSGIKFPCYFSESQFVLFSYTNPQSEGTQVTCKMIHPQAELVILPPSEIPSKKLRGDKQNGEIDSEEIEDTDEEDLSEIQFLKLRTTFRSLENNHRLLISRNVFEKYKIQENRLYKISLERIVKESEYSDFKMFLNKLQQAQKQKTSEDKPNGGNRTVSTSTNSHSMVTLGIADDIPDQHVAMNEFMQHALQIDKNSIVSIDLHFELANIKENRILQLSEFISPQNKIKLVFRQIYGVNGKSDLAKDHSSLISQVISRYLAGKQDIYYTDQIFSLRGNYYILKIVEIMQDTKEILKTVVFENNNSSLQNSSSNSQKGTESERRQYEKTPAEIIEENQVLALQLTSQIIFSSQQEFFSDFHETEVIAINTLVKSKIHVDQFATAKLGIYDVLYAKEAEQLKEFFDEKNNKNNVLQITGKSQSGKTYSIEYIKQRFPNYHIEVIDFAELQEQVLLEYAKQYIVTKIQIAYFKAPSVIVCENIERMCKSLDRIDFQQHQLILVSEIISKFLKDQMKKYLLGSQNVKFIVLSESKDSVNANIPKIVEIQVNLETANYSRRKLIFEYLEQACGIQLDVDTLGSMTENFNLNEFFILSQKLFQEKTIIKQEDIFEKINELSNKSFKSSKTFPKFEHVGGLFEVKDTIKETFEVPIKYEFLFKNIPIKLPRGVLLYGPPGCGKTYLAKATANELGLNFFSVKGPEILNKYIGASEQAVRDIFEKAYSVRPSIVFFDEFDAIVPRRNSGSTGVTDRVVNQFLCYLDGVASLEGVCILAASSRPDLIDPALLRPGRIDRHVYLGFPDENERRLIFGIFGRNLKMEEGLDIEDLVKGTENFTSADLVAFLKEIRIKMAHDMIEAKKLDPQFQFDFTLTREFLEKSYKVFRPSLNPKEILKFEQMYAKFSDPKAVQDISKQKQTLI